MYGLVFWLFYTLLQSPILIAIAIMLLADQFVFGFRSRLSRRFVENRRMARLERDKVIVGYRAVMGERTDDESLSAVLSVTFSQRPCFPVVEKFRDWPEIAHYYSVTGPLDAYVVVKVKNAQDLSRFVDRLSAVPGVGAVRSAVVLKADFA